MLRLLLSLLCCLLLTAQAQDTLLRDFRTPPRQSWPRAWWHWIGGNISPEGIRRDIMWMDSVGIGGFHLLDAGLDAPQTAPRRIPYMSAEWQQCLRLALHLADSLGMEAAIATAPGWSNTGGPWVTTDDAMKRIEWRDTVITVPAPHSPLLTPHSSLLTPYTVSGTFQNVQARSRSRQVPYYRDICTLAIPEPETVEGEPAEIHYRAVTSHTGHFTAQGLTDGDYDTAWPLPMHKKERTSWVTIELDTPRTVRAISIADTQTLEKWRVTALTPAKYLEVSTDGTHYRRLCPIPNGAAPRQTIDIPPTRGRYFRIVYNKGEAPAAISEITLWPTVRVDHGEEKAGFATTVGTAGHVTPESATAIPLDSVRDITGPATPLPPGRWRVYRFGYSLTGKENHPATPEATGLEVDKLDSAAVARYLARYLATYREAVADPDSTLKPLTHLLMDSYEAGAATWTTRMREEFSRRRGYDLLPWLPTLAGTVIESGAATDRFLYHYRQTLAELITENLYRQTARTAHDHGLHTYFEAMENHRPFIADGMEVKAQGDIPMAAMWARGDVMRFRDKGFLEMQADMLESASAAHVYGRRLVAAESFTAYGPERKDSMAYIITPERLKRVADLEFASGINRIVIHSVVHQPTDDLRPGLSLGVYGQWLGRHETWAPLAKPWMDYLSRTSYLLSLGTPVADVAYYYGEEANAVELFGQRWPAVPHGVAFDLVNTDALTRLLTTDGHRWLTPSGMSYRLMALDSNATRMTLPALRRLRDRVAAGAPLCGPRPTICLGAAADTVAFRQTADEIWGAGRSHVFANASVAAALDSLGVLPDVSGSATDSMRYIHRRTADADIYWVYNRSEHVLRETLAFRVTGRRPTLWQAETGETREVSYAIGTRSTYVDLRLEPGEAIFVVFRGQPHAALRHTVTPADTLQRTVLHTPWQITFPMGQGTPREITTDTLRWTTDSLLTQGLSAREAQAIHHYSGTIVYRTPLPQLSSLPTPHSPLLLRLPEVRDLAEVWIDGQRVATLWHAPFEADITQAVRAGGKMLEVRVTNTWKNRLIGDRLAPGSQRRTTYTSYPWSRKSTRRLVPAGMRGRAEIVEIRN